MPDLIRRRRESGKRCPQSKHPLALLAILQLDILNSHIAIAAEGRASVGHLPRIEGFTPSEIAGLALIAGACAFAAVTALLLMRSWRRARGCMR